MLTVPSAAPMPSPLTASSVTLSGAACRGSAQLAASAAISHFFMGFSLLCMQKGVRAPDVASLA